VITVDVPGALQAFSRGRSVVLDAPCATVREALVALGARHPGLLDRVLDERGELRPHVNVFVGDANTRFAGGLGAPVAEGSTITILPAVSGG
jgi:sulfur-carrier protein